jgi:anti-sigma B factor antagonist
MMIAKANVRQSGDVAIVDLAGRITMGEGSGVVRSAIKELLAGGRKNILLNLKDVTYIDSAGLGELVSAFASVNSAAGGITLLHVQGKVRDLLQITKLYTVFPAYDDELAAVRSFAHSATAGKLFL